MHSEHSQNTNTVLRNLKATSVLLAMKFDPSSHQSQPKQHCKTKHMFVFQMQTFENGQANLFAVFQQLEIDVAKTNSFKEQKTALVLFSHSSGCL